MPWGLILMRQGEQRVVASLLSGTTEEEGIVPFLWHV